jgi:rod shape-determining protein MreC
MLIPRKYHSYIIAAVLLIISLAIISYSASKIAETGFLRKIAFEIAAPFTGIVNTSIKGAGTFWKRYLVLVELEKENKQLREEKTALTEQLNIYREGYHEGIRLGKLLELSDALPYKFLAARVLDNKSNALFKTILINKGTADGLFVGYPILSAEGVVGRITESSWHYSRVLLLIDKNSNIDAIIQRNRAHGIMQGTGMFRYKLKYIPRSEEVLRGDILLSSGMAGLFPKGLILGTVTKAYREENELFQRIDVIPSVNFSKLEEVLVLIPEKVKGR